MSDTSGSLRQKIRSAGDLQSVVRTMRALAAASVGQYERSVHALDDYVRTVELGLSACFRESDFRESDFRESDFRESDGLSAATDELEGNAPEGETVGAVVFGSDQGLVGQFNEVVADFAIDQLQSLGGDPAIWAVGERVQARLSDAGQAVVGGFSVPTSIDSITRLVGKIQLETDAHRTHGKYARVYIFHNRPLPGGLYAPVHQRLLPLDAAWKRRLCEIQWPTRNPPEVLGGGRPALHALIREYLFISLYRACSESLASENASRLAAMQRADENIDELLQKLRITFHRLRQQRIDEELFDVVAGYEASAPDERYESKR